MDVSELSSEITDFTHELGRSVRAANQVITGVRLGTQLSMGYLGKQSKTLGPITQYGMRIGTSAGKVAANVLRKRVCLYALPFISYGIDCSPKSDPLIFYYYIC